MAGAPLHGKAERPPAARRVDRNQLRLFARFPPPISYRFEIVEVLSTALQERLNPNDHIRGIVVEMERSCDA